MQADVLREFFAREQRFVLTGGGAPGARSMRQRRRSAVRSSDGDLRRMLADAERKDAGISPATLAWLLDGIRIGVDASLPGVTVAELDAFRRDLVQKLRMFGLPPE